MPKISVTVFCDNSASVFVGGGDIPPDPIHSHIMKPQHWAVQTIKETEVLMYGDGPWTVSGYCKGDGPGKHIAGFGAKVTSGGKTLSMTNYNGTQNEFDIIKTGRNEDPPANWYSSQYVRADIVRHLRSNDFCSVNKIKHGTWSGNDPAAWPWGGVISGIEPIWIGGCGGYGSDIPDSKLHFKLHLMKDAQSGMLLFFCASILLHARI